MRVAVAQMEPKLAEKERNLDACLARLEEAAAAGAELTVFPECAIPGYMFDSAEEALPLLHAMLTVTTGTEDAAEGIAAFAEKRDPRWTGRSTINSLRTRPRIG